LCGTEITGVAGKESSGYQNMGAVNKFARISCEEISVSNHYFCCPRIENQMSLWSFLRKRRQLRILRTKITGAVLQNFL
jgi:hypothetical protein